MIVYAAEKVIYFSVFMCFLSSAGQMVIRKRRRENYNLALLFFLMGIMLLQMYLLVTGNIHNYSFMFNFHAVVLYTFSPLLYYAYYVVSLPGRGIKKNFFLFFIPVLPALAADIYFFFLERETRLMIINDFAGNINTTDVAVYKVIIAGAFVQILLYHLWLIKILWPLLRDKENKDIIGITIFYSFFSAAAALIAIPGYIFSNMDILRFSTLIISLCFIFTYFVSIRHPHFLQLLSITVERQGYSKSLLKGLNIDELMGKLKKLMEDDRVYLDENISLTSVSRLMGLSHHQLSQLLNEKYNMNFNTFVNSYRVDEARKLLIECPEKTVLAIAYESGFNSKSSFYDSFTRFTGLTPVEYRKKSR
jgi:AraC-like DNA-binding protein